MRSQHAAIPLKIWKMEMMQLESDTWTLGNRLTGGGFGEIFDVTRADGQEAVAKRIKKTPGADRELLFGDNTKAAGCRNVIHILDKGEYQDTYVLIMPKASTNLTDYLTQSGGAISLQTAVDILTDIATALFDLERIAVHRDLKPDNILFWEGAWRVADFGISRFADAATATQTQKRKLTAPYAAPEQWRFEHATAATDAYAFGVIAYELLAGTRPFPGPDTPDYRNQHLKDTPPQLPTTIKAAALTVLVGDCLAKAPDIRPKPGRILELLSRALAQPPTTGESFLAQANADVARREVEKDAAASKAQEEAREADGRYDAASTSYKYIVDSIRRSLEVNASKAVFTQPSSGNSKTILSARLGAGTLGFSTLNRVEDHKDPFTIVAMAGITVRYTEPPEDSTGYRGRLHELWFCDALAPGDFDWYEVALTDSPLKRGIPRATDPYAAELNLLDNAFRKVTGASPGFTRFSKIDRADLSEFISRWTKWFAQASNGDLQRPSSIPEGPILQWRRASRFD